MWVFLGSHLIKGRGEGPPSERRGNWVRWACQGLKELSCIPGEGRRDGGGRARSSRAGAPPSLAARSFLQGFCLLCKSSLGGSFCKGGAAVSLPLLGSGFATVSRLDGQNLTEDQAIPSDLLGTF
ncbi:Hypothetical predicted protein [Podarcis lilfordi]|uniref:Uncharacterized protein n=1 Tax=Podarcis lilfordi TaxID=74358 RepID=A0AA35L8U0_9SAUR|nr:Hypothetical predicted protein [Podarcis lilfordi]